MISRCYKEEGRCCEEHLEKISQTEKRGQHRARRTQKSWKVKAYDIVGTLHSPSSLWFPHVEGGSPDFVRIPSEIKERRARLRDGAIVSSERLKARFSSALECSR